jgi:hypothetical protein
VHDLHEILSALFGFFVHGHGSAPARLARRSSGLGEIAKLLASEQPLCILDLGYTSAANIRYLTERGHKIYSEDLLEASTDPEW